MTKTIMVVDDNPDLTFSVKQGLEDLDDDFVVLEVDGGKKCLKLLEKEQLPHLILLDIMMPGLNGWETFDKIRENESWKHIPIVFLTARTDDIARNAGKFLGKDYIEKPFDIIDLKQRIDDVLKQTPEEQASIGKNTHETTTPDC